VPVEVERKFVAANPRPADQLGRGVRMRQGYLAEDGDVTLRVRISDAGSWLTVKAGSGLARTEVEVTIDDEAAEELWPHTNGRQLEKTRYRVELPESGLVAEVDLFEGELDGLCLVEVEFDSVDAANGFDPPQWFGREVTGQPGWSNADLARSGRPPS
jgi:CYTH domain-containing protein